jgi:Tol biopolymer transport system component
MSLTQLTTASHNNRTSSIPSISGDGGKIAFVSDSDFLGQGLPNDQFEIWLYNTATLTVTRITTASAANRNSGYSNLPGLSLSGDGSKIAFVSDSDFLGQGIPDGQYEIWLYDTSTLTVTRITTASDSNRNSHFPVLDADGSRIAFFSDSDFLGQGIPDGQNEVWLYDVASVTFTRLTTDSHGDRISFHPSINADGSKVAFMSNSDLLGQGIPREQAEIWLYDTSVMTFTRITTALGGSTRASEGPSLSADGESIAFHSYADLLGEGLPGTYSEIWLYRSSVPTTGPFYFPMIFKKRSPYPSSNP